MKEVIWISIGAIFGANARYFAGRLIAEALRATFPVGTLLINITGSLALGFFMALTTRKFVSDPSWRFLIAVGFCGTYTTFSTFAYESFALLQHGQWLRFTLNVAGTNMLCLLAMAIGVKLGG